MKLWVDDIRDPKDFLPDPENWVWAKTFEEAITHINTGNVTSISLDHDLGGELDQDGDELDGYTIACHIEFLAFTGDLPRMRWNVHSANPVGAKNIEGALKQADKYWSQYEREASNKTT